MKTDSFEHSLAELQKLADRIKAQDTSLEEAIRCYEEGMKYYRVCSTILDDAKQKIEIFEEEV